MKKTNIFALLVIIALTSNATGRTSTAWPYNAWPQDTAFTSGDEDVYSIIEKAQDAYNKDNHKEAVRLYRIAAERGNSLAQYRLGTRYFLGEGVTKSAEEAFKWWKRAAEQGHLRAQSLQLLDGNDILLFDKGQDSFLPDAVHRITQMLKV